MGQDEPTVRDFYHLLRRIAAAESNIEAWRVERTIANVLERLLAGERAPAPPVDLATGWAVEEGKRDG